MNFAKRTAKRGLMVSLLAVAATGALASSHREAPGITKSPKIDATDFYMFRSYEPGREDYVTFIANYQPLQAPYGGPNYFTMDSDAIYEIHIDNDGDAVEDITFQFDFENTLGMEGAGISVPVGDARVAIPLKAVAPISGQDGSGLNEVENYKLNVIRGPRRSGDSKAVTMVSGGANFGKPVDNIGNKTIPDYDDYTGQFMYDVTIPGCDAPGRVFVGQRAEAFAVNLGGIFDLVNFVPLEGSIEQSRDNDDLVGKFNVTSLAIEVPTSCVTAADSPVIGAWTTSSLPQAQIEDPSPTYEGTSVYGGAWVQQSRLSNPLVNEVVIGLPDKDLFNAAQPTQDAALAQYVTNPTLPFLLDALFREPLGASGNIAPDFFPRNDLVAAFLTGFPGVNQLSTVTPSEMMRLNTSFPITPRDAQQPLGLVAEDLAGYPNGRRPGDDTVDIALRVVMGALCHPVPLGAELGVEGAVEDTETDLVNLGILLDICTPEDAPVGNLPFTDGAPISAAELSNAFPYLNSPLPGATN